MDPNCIWIYLQLYDYSNDPIYINIIRVEFDSFILDPFKTKILDKILKL
jgi:hypothetical protein